VLGGVFEIEADFEQLTEKSQKCRFCTKIAANFTPKKFIWAKNQMWSKF
jgi:hypothetical protein